MRRIIMEGKKKEIDKDKEEEKEEEREGISSPLPISHIQFHSLTFLLLISIVFRFVSWRVTVIYSAKQGDVSACSLS